MSHLSFPLHNSYSPLHGQLGSTLITSMYPCRVKITVGAAVRCYTRLVPCWATKPKPTIGRRVGSQSRTETGRERTSGQKIGKPRKHRRAPKGSTARVGGSFVVAARRGPRRCWGRFRGYLVQHVRRRAGNGHSQRRVTVTRFQGSSLVQR